MGRSMKNVSNSNGAGPRLRIAIPSDGAMYDPTLSFFAAAGMPIDRPSPRRYVAAVPAIPGVEVILQRARDITAQVEAGNADAGFVGYDDYRERRVENGDTILALTDLGFGRCELVLAVPDSWVDVESMADVADLSVQFRESGRELRIATKAPRLAQRFLFGHGVNYFSLPQVSGTLEAAPAMGYADLIIDITATGTSLRENRLKRLRDGTVIESEGCMIVNGASMRAKPDALEGVREVLERIDARREARDYCRITANIEGASEEAVAAKVHERPEAAGLHGPTVARVFAADGGSWYAVTVFARRDDLALVVDHFRAIGGASVTVSQADYVFAQENTSYRQLLATLGPR